MDMEKLRPYLIMVLVVLPPLLGLAFGSLQHISAIEGETRTFGFISGVFITSVLAGVAAWSFMAYELNCALKGLGPALAIALYVFTVELAVYTLVIALGGWWILLIGFGVGLFFYGGQHVKRLIEKKL